MRNEASRARRTGRRIWLLPAAAAVLLAALAGAGYVLLLVVTRD